MNTRGPAAAALVAERVALLTAGNQTALDALREDLEASLLPPQPSDHDFASCKAREALSCSLRQYRCRSSGYYRPSESPFY